MFLWGSCLFREVRHEGSEEDDSYEGGQEVQDIQDDVVIIGFYTFTSQQVDYFQHYHNQGQTDRIYEYIACTSSCDCSQKCQVRQTAADEDELEPFFIEFPE